MSIRKNHKIGCALLSRPREMIPSQYHSRACSFTGGVTIVERLWKEIVPSPGISEPALKVLKASMPDQHPIHRDLHIHPVTNLDHFWDRNLYWTRMMVFVKLTVEGYGKENGL